jgi:hypothetical protein
MGEGAPMLTDEELTTRLSAAFEESVPELEYAGAVPRVRHGGGLAATSVLAGAVALALAPAALQHTDDRAAPRPGASPLAGHRSHGPEHAVRHTLDLGTLHLVYATTAGQSDLFYVLGPVGLAVPADATPADLDIPAQVWFATDPQGQDPDVYVRPDGSSMTYGILARGWTHQQLVDLLEHPVQTERSRHHH